MESQNNSAESLGMNRTGAMMSPMESTKTAEGAEKMTRPLKGDEYTGFAENRIRYMREAEPVGTVPIPATLKGAFSALQEKIMNGDHTFMDKLGERIAFERTGYRLYDALISKYKGTGKIEGMPALETLEMFHQQELSHFHLLVDAMKSIGGDPTCMTPAADVAGVAAMGWVQVMNDPRTDFKQCLEIILQAELVDNACWEVLISLADSLGLKNLSEGFNKAHAEEQIHLSTIQSWVKDLNVKSSKLLS